MLHFLYIIVIALPTIAIGLKVNSEKSSKTYGYRLEERERVTIIAIAIVGRAITMYRKGNKGKSKEIIQQMNILGAPIIFSYAVYCISMKEAASRF